MSAKEMRVTAKEDAVGSIGVASLLEISLVLTNTLVWSYGRSAVWFGSDGIVLTITHLFANESTRGRDCDSLPTVLTAIQPIFPHGHRPHTHLRSKIDLT